jgi:hypothetical protein
MKSGSISPGHGSHLIRSSVVGSLLSSLINPLALFTATLEQVLSMSILRLLLLIQATMTFLASCLLLSGP